MFPHLLLLNKYEHVKIYLESLHMLKIGLMVLKSPFQTYESWRYEYMNQLEYGIPLPMSHLNY